MRKKLSLLAVLALVVGLLAGLMLPSVAANDGLQGCSHSFWKSASDGRWSEAGYQKTQLLSSVFTIPGPLSDLADDSLLDALNYGGGSGVEGDARILFKQAVAALLNAGHPDVAYMYDEATIVTMVNGTLLSMDRAQCVPWRVP